MDGLYDSTMNNLMSVQLLKDATFYYSLIIFISNVYLCVKQRKEISKLILFFLL